MLKFKIFSELNVECETIWKKLEQNSKNDFFQTYDYHKELILNYDIKRLNIVVIFNNNDPVALFPFFIKEYYFFRVLQYIGTKYSDYCNPLVDAGSNNILSEKAFNILWREIINNLKEIDFIFLNNQLKNFKNFKNPVVYNLKNKKFSNIFRIDLLDNFEEYKKNIFEINKNYHYEIHRTLLKKDKLKKNYNLKFEINNLQDTDLKLEKIIDSKISSFSKKRGKINLDIRLSKVFNNLSKKYYKNFFISSLRVENEIVAACFSIKYQGIFYYFIPVIFSRKFEKYKIGKILILDLIDWCIKKDIKIFDFGLGAEKYKKHFSNSSLGLFRYYYFKNIKGFMLFILLKIISFLGIKQF